MAKTMIHSETSVVMSVYNGADYLEESISSILNQTYPCFEFLIINDCSTDHSKDIILSFRDSRIRLIDNEFNLGLARSLIKGIKFARGEFIARHDADDISLPMRLEKQVNYLKRHPHVALIGSRFIVIDEAGNFLFNAYPPSSSAALKRELSFRDPIAHGSTTFRKICLEKVGTYRAEFKEAEDYDLWLRISEHFDLAIVPEFLYKWRFHIESASISRYSIQSYFAALALQLHKERLRNGKDRLQLRNQQDLTGLPEFCIDHASLLSKDQIIKNYNMWGIGLLTNNCNQAAVRLFRKSIHLQRFHMKSWLLLFLAKINSVLPFMPLMKEIYYQYMRFTCLKGELIL